MAEALRVRAVEHNVDLRGRALVSFGGAAGLHAVGIAARLGIRRVICPPRTGVFSAAGLLVAPLAVDAAETWIAPLAQLDVDQIRSRFARLTGRATAELGYRRRQARRHSHSLEMSYVGQEFEIDVPLPSLPLETPRWTGSRSSSRTATSASVVAGSRVTTPGRDVAGPRRCGRAPAHLGTPRDERPEARRSSTRDESASEPGWHDPTLHAWDAMEVGDPLSGPSSSSIGTPRCSCRRAPR